MATTGSDGLTGFHRTISRHGLRKAFTRRLVHAGLTHAQGKALTGHVTDAEFNRYALCESGAVS
jgi:hypothetical protein